MANTKLNIFEHPKQLLVLMTLILAGFVFLHAPKAHAAACPTPTTDMGSVTSTINITNTGNYRAWSRMTQGTTSSDNSYSLQIADPSGNKTCFVVGDTTLPTTFNNDSSNWVDWQNASTTSFINYNFASTGNYTITMIGREDGVKLDRVGFTTDTTCIPTGTGSTGTSPCFPPVDTTPPVVNITAPAQGAHVKGTVNIVATNSDNSGIVSKLELYVDGSNPCTGTPGTLVTSMNNPPTPATLSWPTSGLSNAGHAAWVKAYDPSGNSACTVDLVTVDNSPPTVSITSPANGANITTSTVTLSANATDNVGVTNVTFYYGGNTAIGSVNTGTNNVYSYTWNVSGLTSGSYTITAKAFDAATNVTTSSPITINISSGTGGCSTDTTPPTTSITSQTNKQVVNGTINISASATDTCGVKHVELYIDGILSADDTASPFVFSFDTSKVLNGNHTLQTKAYDNAGNVGSSSVITINVNNATSNVGDINGDGHVTVSDLNILLTNYIKIPDTTCNATASCLHNQGDLIDFPSNNPPDTGHVNVRDMNLLLTHDPS